MNLEEISQILGDRGQQQYDGEQVSQLEHALQCAYLAQQAKASANMIAACLFHDLGHLLPGKQPHEQRAIILLGNIFPPEVTEAIRLHVEAKRYLCGVIPEYWDNLSVASQNSLIIQGGKFSPQEAQQFLEKPFAMSAIQLRQWDEQAKIPQLPTPDLDHFTRLIS